MKNLTELIDKWTNSSLELREAETFINLLILENKRMEELEEKLEKILLWANAYPLEIFPEPDFKKAAQVLKENGITLDAISASCMRHVINGVKAIIEA